MDFGDGRRGVGAAAALVAGWYAFVWMVARPLSDAPVVDSWIYQHAVRALAETGRLRFGGYTQAMPVGQTLYGLAWSRLFGFSAPSLDLSVALLGIAGALMLYALARRCGARPQAALLATGLLICNPCYLFLSFSFMTEVPFLAPLIGCLLAFACAEGSRHEQRWLWLAAALGVVAFSVRPFGGAALIGCAAALALYDRELWCGAPGAPSRLIKRLAPFALASLVCAAFWIRLVHAMRPWSLAYSEARSLNAFFLVPAPRYLKLWVLWPLLYLGLALAPLALVHAASRWRRALTIASAILAVAVVLTALEDHFVWRTPDCRCFGGWPGALTLHGMPQRLRWADFGVGAGWLVAVLASLGAAGLCVSAAQAIPRMSRGAAALMMTAAVYWLATLPLWLFADRYYLVMVPAGCVLLALAPLPSGRAPVAAAAIMTAMMGLVSLGGLYTYQRGAQSVLEARDALLAAGVPRAGIDAGYSLNGHDLYRYPRDRPDTLADERGIPMVTTPKPGPYTIAAAPIAGAEIVRRFSWPGPLGFGARPLYVLRLTASHADSDRTGARAPAH